MTEDEIGFTPEELETLQLALLDLQKKWGDDATQRTFLRALYAKLGCVVSKEYRPLRYAPVNEDELRTPLNPPPDLAAEGDCILAWINESDLVWLRLRNMALKHV